MIWWILAGWLGANVLFVTFWVIVVSRSRAHRIRREDEVLGMFHRERVGL